MLQNDEICRSETKHFWVAYIFSLLLFTGNESQISSTRNDIDRETGNTISHADTFKTSVDRHENVVLAEMTDSENNFDMALDDQFSTCIDLEIKTATNIGLFECGYNGLKTEALDLDKDCDEILCRENDLYTVKGNEKVFPEFKDQYQFSGSHDNNRRENPNLNSKLTLNGTIKVDSESPISEKKENKLKIKSASTIKVRMKEMKPTVLKRQGFLRKHVIQKQQRTKYLYQSDNDKMLLDENATMKENSKTTKINQNNKLSADFISGKVKPRKKTTKVDSDIRKKDYIYCKECKHLFSFRSNYERHIETDKCRHECEYCGKVFLYGLTSNYKLHLKYHNKQMDYHCKICGKLFIEKGKMLQHFNRHTIAKPVICDQCGEGFGATSLLTSHKRNKHTANKQKYPCTKCPKVLGSSSGFKYHFRHKHDAEYNKSYPCFICGKVFKERKLCIIHEASHKDVKDFKCDQCDASFKLLGPLNQHKKRHSKAYTHMCTVCNKGFYLPSELHSHERTHTGEKPYKCNICEYRCAHRSNLCKHKKIHAN